MRTAVLWASLATAAAVYAAMLVTLACSTTRAGKSTVIELFFALVPWLILIVCAAPAARAVLAGG